MTTTKAIRHEAVEFIAQEFQTKPYEWFTDNRFVDHHGCDGYIFKSERAARRYVLSDIHEWGSVCESASDDSVWLGILHGLGMKMERAKKIIASCNWELVAKTMLNAYGPAYFLSTYSGQVNTLSDGSLLYY